MSSIVRQRVKDRIYLYESVSYRNEEGKLRNKRTLIAKIEPTSNQPIYKPEYIARMKSVVVHLENPSPTTYFSAEDIKQSCILEFGAQYLLEQLGLQMGLLEALQQAFPNGYQELFTLGCYLVGTGDPFLYCEEWIKKTACGEVGNLSSQRISELLQSITPEARTRFYKTWCTLRCEQEYLALDITSTSSYSEFIQDVEWGYNRDHEMLPQINICMLMGETSRLPIYQTTYSGSLKDVSTLEATLSQMDAVSDGKPLLTVMDKGFFSTKNINALLNRETPLGFIISVPFSAGFAKKAVLSEQKDIDCIQNVLVLGEDTFRAVTKYKAWNSLHKLHTHIYYNALKALKIREELYALVATLKERAEQDPIVAQKDEYASKYLIIRKSEKTDTGYTISIREEVIAKQLETAGWLVIVSNTVSDAKTALSIYRQKDVVEKGFLRLKTQLDLGRLRVHRDDSMQNKIFIGFIALILLSHINKVMLDEALYKKMTTKKMLMILSKLRVQNIGEQRILFPLTKDQKLIYNAFNVTEPV